MRKTIAVCSLILWFAGAAIAQVDPPSTKPVYPKLGSRLSAVVAAADRGVSELAAVGTLGNPEPSDATIPVTLMTANQGEVLEWLRIRGFRVANALGDTIEVFLPVAGLRALNGHPAVISVREILPPQQFIVGQGPAVHNATNWHSSGLTGDGVKVGVIDVGLIG